jgi:hypothetical protein
MSVIVCDQARFPQVRGQARRIVNEGFGQGMSDILGGPMGGERAPRPLTTVYLRAVALLLLAAGLVRACQILGITPDGRDFSDLAPQWRAAAAGLLLIDLFAAVGLWLGAAWGAVMWAVALAVEVAMHTLFADLFGANPVRIGVHSLFFAIYLALAFIDWRRDAGE